MVAKEGLKSFVPVVVTCANTSQKTRGLIYSDFQISRDRHICANIDEAADCLPQRSVKSGRQDEQSHGSCSDLNERKASHLEIRDSDISDLVGSTKQISIHLRSVEQGIESDHRNDHHEHLSRYLNMFFPQNQESKPKGELSDCSDLAVSTDTEFRSMMTSSQIAAFAHNHFKNQNEMQKRTVELLETDRQSKHEERQCDDYQLESDAGRYLSLAENECKQEFTSSPELFSSDCDEKNIGFEDTRREESANENAGESDKCNIAARQFINEIRIEPLSSGILCSQVESSHKSSYKRARKSEDLFHIFNTTLKRQLKSKRVKLNSSPSGPGMTVDQERIEFKSQGKLLSPLKDCCCENQKYNVLVTVVHPCLIKEIQMKTRPKSSSKVPVATIVVIDQSETKRKVVLWRGAAFWSLTVFPGDIVLLTDIMMYENHWYGEIMLQSTFTSQLLNLGNYSILNPEEFYPAVNGDVLHGLLAYVSSEFPHFGDVPRRQVQRLDSVQYVQLDQLQPNTLVHSILKIISIAILTESVYSYRGGYRRKIILTVEQNRDQHYKMVLWGAGAAWCPQLQRRKGKTFIGCYHRISLIPLTALKGSTWSYFSIQPLTDNSISSANFQEPFVFVPRPALMTVEDGGCEINIHVVSELMEKIFLNIPADWLNRSVVPSSDITYGTIVADLCHSLLADMEASYLLEIRSHFELDENSYPLQKDFHLLNFHPDL
uniref:Shieldin complex subunit 2 n=1 Tax=Pavo cristatus TaxID=9049 RepID=A0A8C9F608_PAVCR